MGASPRALPPRSPSTWASLPQLHSRSASAPALGRAAAAAGAGTAALWPKQRARRLAPLRSAIASRAQVFRSTAARLRLQPRRLPPTSATAAARRDVARALENAAGTESGAAGQAERAAAGKARAAHQAGAEAERGAEASAARRAERAAAAPTRWRQVWRSAAAWSPAAPRKPLLCPAGAAGELGAGAHVQRALGEAAVAVPYTTVVVAAAPEGSPGTQRVDVLVAVPGSRPVDVKVGRRSMQGFAHAG